MNDTSLSLLLDHCPEKPTLVPNASCSPHLTVHVEMPLRAKRSLLRCNLGAKKRRGKFCWNRCCKRLQSESSPVNDEQFVLSSIRQAGRQLQSPIPHDHDCAQEKSQAVLEWCVMESHSNSCSTKLFIMLTGAFSPSKQHQVSNGCGKVVTPQLEHSAQVRVSQLLRVATKVECHWESFARC